MTADILELPVAVCVLLILVLLGQTVALRLRTDELDGHDMASTIFVIVAALVLQIDSPPALLLWLMNVALIGCATWNTRYMTSGRW